MTKAQEKIYELEVLDKFINLINQYKEDDEYRLEDTKGRIKDYEESSYDYKYYTSEAEKYQKYIDTYIKIQTLLEKTI